TLFMLNVKKDYRKEIKLLKSKEAIVYTKSQLTVRDFIGQRIRWTSKAKLYRDFDVIYTSFIVLIINVSVFISMILVFTGSNYLLYPVLLCGKTLADTIFMNSILGFFNKKRLLKLLVLFQVIYPVYISTIGILGNIARYSWKNRRNLK
ncbi:MAG: hypothetical protein JSV22_03600, partial [Bacteroidales bacterium]